MVFHLLLEEFCVWCAMGDDTKKSINGQFVPPWNEEEEPFNMENNENMDDLTLEFFLGPYEGSGVSNSEQMGELGSVRNQRRDGVSSITTSLPIVAASDVQPLNALPYRQPNLDLEIGLPNHAEPHASTSTTTQASEELSNVDAQCTLTDQGFLGKERDGPGHDFQHKRPKIALSQLCHFDAIACLGSSASSSERAHEPFQVSFPSETEMIRYLNSVSNDFDDGLPRDTTTGSSDAVGDGASMSKDMEVKMDLTDDLLHMVFSFLGHIDLCRAARVCRQWRAASSHEDFWKCLNFENRNITPVQFGEMCRRYPRATEVNILGVPFVDVISMEFLFTLRNIEFLTVGKGLLEDGFFHVLRDCPTLKHLTISEASLGSGLQEIPIVHEKLRHLQIVKCRALRISVRCPQLETLSLRRTNMAHASLNCLQLRDLNISFCHKLSDAGIRSVVTSCSLLTALDVSNCLCISDETLREIAQTCLNLHVLNASYCPNISLESVTLSMLTDLKLEHCEGITSASMTAISRSSFLEALELDCCGLLTSVSLDLRNLQRIMLRHCRKFVDLNLRSHVLSSISVSNCGALRNIIIISNSLKKLVLQKQESLTTLLLQCQCLQEVDLTDCESLTNSVCYVFSDGGGCPMIRSLVLDNCESLTMVEFKTTTLVNLSLVGCRGMTTLNLGCPNLANIQLDGCDHLEKASFYPVGLGSLNLGICPKLSTLHIEASQMTVLELKGCGVLSRAVITCPMLTSLDASFCSQLPDECLSATAASCPLIESLILMSCPSVGLKGLSSLGWLPHLTLLDLSYTFLMSLQPVFETCQQLKVLKLQACKYLTNSSLDALCKGALPELRELDLSNGTIGQSSIEELLMYCTHLTHVSLRGCENMHDLHWNVSGVDDPVISIQKESVDGCELIEHPSRLLESLNCVGCPNIKKVAISSTAGFHNLSMLNLSLSANLKEVDLGCPNLNFLNLSNCCSLEVLKLQCPRLSSLSLPFCSIAEDALETAVSNCCLLETLDVRFCPKIHTRCLTRLRVVCPSLKRILNSTSA